MSGLLSPQEHLHTLIAYLRSYDGTHHQAFLVSRLDDCNRIPSGVSRDGLNTGSTVIPDSTSPHPYQPSLAPSLVLHLLQTPPLQMSSSTCSLSCHRPPQTTPYPRLLGLLSSLTPDWEHLEELSASRPAGKLYLTPGLTLDTFQGCLIPHLQPMTSPPCNCLPL